MEIFLIFFWYAFGWIGSILLLMMILFSTTMIYRTLHLEDKNNQTNNWRRMIAWLYEYFDFDCWTDELKELYISLPVTCIMATLAMFGIYMIPAALIVSFITYFTIEIWRVFQNK